jgi:GNAT superfamily N-acetyltransferase
MTRHIGVTARSEPVEGATVERPNSAASAAIVERAEADAWLSMYRHAPTSLANALGVTATAYGTVAVLGMAHADFRLVNRAIGLGIGEPATEERLDEILAVYHGLGVGAFVVQVSPEAQPAGLAAWLAARGLVAGSAWAKTLRGDQPVPSVPSDLTVRPLLTADAATFGDVAIGGFEMPAPFAPLFAGVVGKPGWHTYLAYDGDEPVATAGMYVDGEVAWLGMGSTLPSHRRHGAQGALLARRVEDGREMGCRWFVTETGAEDPEKPNGSLRNMLRVGFEIVYFRQNYARPRPS